MNSFIFRIFKFVEFIFNSWDVFLNSWIAFWFVEWRIGSCPGRCSFRCLLSSWPHYYSLSWISVRKQVELYESFLSSGTLYRHCFPRCYFSAGTLTVTALRIIYSKRPGWLIICAGISLQRSTYLELVFIFFSSGAPIQSLLSEILVFESKHAVLALRFNIFNM